MDEIKLCFFAHAGSSSRSYANFKKFLDPRIKPVPIEIAGRGSRLDEPRFTNAEDCARDVFIRNRDLFAEGNYAFFGHSLGTVISFETIRLIKKCGLPSPMHAYFSSRPAPQSTMEFLISGASELSDEEFIRTFSRYGGLPVSIAQNAEMLNMLLPILRDDVKMADNYHPQYTEPQIDTDITICYGLGDQIYSGEDIDQWKKVTTGKFETLEFEGDHFYFNIPDNKQRLCDHISRTLLG